ncbi:hypothetical protein THAOC_06572, partial [Thalassiosira oceanica]
AAAAAVVVRAGGRGLGPTRPRDSRISAIISAERSSGCASSPTSPTSTSPIARRIYQVKNAFTSITKAKGTNPSMGDGDAGDAGDDSNRNRHSEDEVLKFVGFDERRQAIPSITVAAILDDLVEDHPELKYDYFFMTLNWLYLYETYPVLSGRWQYSENHIGRTVIPYGKMFQQLSRKIIRFEFKDDDGPYLFSLDTVNFLWFDPKSKSAGLKYEFCLSLSEPRIVWIRGPVPASTADITMFRGGTTDVSRDQWDKSALYHQIPNGLGDSSYTAEASKMTTNSPEFPADMKHWIGRCLARQETLHARLKFFNILGHRFRHGTDVEDKMSLHQMAVEADEHRGALATYLYAEAESGHANMPECDHQIRYQTLKPRPQALRITRPQFELWAGLGARVLLDLTVTSDSTTTWRCISLREGGGRAVAAEPRRWVGVLGRMKAALCRRADSRSASALGLWTGPPPLKQDHSQEASSMAGKFKSQEVSVGVYALVDGQRGARA